MSSAATALLGEDGLRGARVGAVAVVLLFVLLTSQGGFYGIQTGLAGVAAWAAVAAVLAKRRGRVSLAPVPLLLSALTLAYGASVLANGATLTTLAELGSCAAVAGFAWLWSLQGEEGREASWNLLCWLGVLLGVVAVFLYAGVFELEGAMHEGRLQFPLQYANGAGILFAVLFYLQLLSGQKALRACAAVSFAALLFTQSAGAVLAFLLAALGLACLLVRREEWELLAHAALQCLVGAAAFALAHLGAASEVALGLAACLAALLLMALAGAACCQVRYEELLRARGRVLSLGLLAAALVCAVAFALLFAPRLAQATGTFLNRVAQWQTALYVLASHPVLGVGPDAWQFVYPRYAVASFHVKAVHCSYLQIACDAGLLGLALIVAVVVCGLRNALRANDLRVGVAFTLLALHALVDFDLQFGGLFALFAMLAAGAGAVSRGEGLRAAMVPAGTSPAAEPSTGGVRVAALSLTAVAGVLALALSLAGMWAASAKAQVQAAVESEDYMAALGLCTTLPFAAKDVDMQSAYLASLNHLGQYQLVDSYCRGNSAANDAQALQIAQAYYALGDISTASDVLLAELEREPHNDALYNAAAAMMREYGLAQDQRPRYSQILSAAQQLSEQGLAPYVKDRRKWDALSQI